MVSHVTGHTSMLEFLRVQSWVHFFLVYISDLPDGVATNAKLLPHFFQLFVILQHLQDLLMMAY